MKKNVFIIGSRGYKKNYGGWETFVDNLVSNNQLNGTEFHVYEISQEVEQKIIVKDGIFCHQVNQKDYGNASMVFFSIKSVINALAYIKANHINNSIFYILGLRIGPFFWLIKKKLKRQGIKVIINPDGLEWKRAKWNWIVKKYFKLSELTMINSSDYVVCDSQGILDYMDSKYNIKNKSSYIPYGYNLDTDYDKEGTNQYLSKYGTKTNDFFLIVGRFVPENNYEMIIRAFMQSKTIKKLLIISNYKTTDKFFQKLLRNVDFKNDDRIIFADSIYNKKILNGIRQNAYAYIHGHSVGGTNPSLLESLGNTNINIVYNVNFNKEVVDDYGLYFDDIPSLIKLIDDLDNISKDEVQRFHKGSIERLNRIYNWSIVREKHDFVFNHVLKE